MVDEHILLESYARYVLPLGRVNGFEKLIRFALSVAPFASVIVRLCASADLPLFQHKLVCGRLRVTNQRLVFRSLPEEIEDVEFYVLFPSILSYEYVPKLLGLQQNLLVKTLSRVERFIVWGADDLNEFITEQVQSIGEEEKPFIIGNYLRGLGADHACVENELEQAFWETANLIESDSHWMRREKLFIRKNLLDIEQLIPSLTKP